MTSFGFSPSSSSSGKDFEPFVLKTQRYVWHGPNTAQNLGPSIPNLKRGGGSSNNVLGLLFSEGNRRARRTGQDNERKAQGNTTKAGFC